MIVQNNKNIINANKIPITCYDAILGCLQLPLFMLSFEIYEKLNTKTY